MAIAAATVFEVRTTGSDTQCSGGFVAGASGTDYSQADTVAFSGTDLAVDASTNTKVTSVTHNFVAADVGNLIQITAGTGWTQGFYQIVSVASNVATLDRSPAATSTTGGIWWEGGALASPGKAAGARVAGNSVWIKTGTYTISTTSANVAGGVVSDALGLSTSAVNAVWEGYAVTRGDLGTPPVLQIAASGVTTVTMFAVTGFQIIVRNINLDGQLKTSIRGFAIGSPFGVSLIGCRASNCTNIGIVGATGNYSERCTVTGCTTSSAAWFAGGTHVACESYGNTIPGFWVSDKSSFERCVSSANSGASSDGWDTRNASSQFLNCVAYGNGRHGFLQTNVTQMVALNCLAEGNGGFGFGSSLTPNTGLLRQCAGYNNTSGNYNTSAFLANAVLGFITGLGSFFTSPGSGDFSLNNVVGGGRLARAAGYPGLFPRGLTTGYLDIGAAQHADPPSGGGSRSRVFGGL